MGSGDYLPNIFWKDDKAGEGKQYKKVVRFLTDDVITTKVYAFVKGGPDGKGRDFLAPGSLVDDNGQPLWSELAGEKDYFITNNILLPTFKGDLKPAAKIAQEKTIGLAVLREEYTVNQDGRAVPHVRDLIETRKWTTQDGEEKTEEGPVYGIINQGYKNFWSILAGYFTRYGTICDRDYEITRSGNGTNTAYSIIAVEKDPTLETAAQRDEHYTPPLTLKDWAIPKARYQAAEEWLTAKPAGAAAGSSAPTEPRDEAPAETRQASGSAADSLRSELEAFKA